MEVPASHSDSHGEVTLMLRTCERLRHIFADTTIATSSSNRTTGNVLVFFLFMAELFLLLGKSFLKSRHKPVDISGTHGHHYVGAKRGHQFYCLVGGA